MSSYPVFSSGKTYQAGLNIASRYPVKTFTFSDGKEQRIRSGLAVRRFALVHEGLTMAELSTLRTFFDARKADYDTFDLTINGTTYNNCAFDQPELADTESQLGSKSVTVNIVQVK